MTCPLCMSVYPVSNIGVLWPNNWMDQDATWHGGRPQPGHIVLDGDPAHPTERDTVPPHFGPCLLWPNGRPSHQLLSSCYMDLFETGHLLCVYVLMKLNICKFPGCGVFAAKQLWSSDFILEYRGELLSGDEGEERFVRGQTGSFLYFFEMEGKKRMW